MTKTIRKGQAAHIAFVAFRLFLLCGLSYVILSPLLAKFSSMFMSSADLYNPIVKYFPLNPTLDNIAVVVERTQYFRSILNSVLISLVSAFLQVMICAAIGYGLAKFKFPGRRLVFGIVILTLIIPTQALSFSLFSYFRYVDPLYLLSLLGVPRPSLINTPVPVFILSALGLGFKNGLYILLFRQFFKGIPQELSEAAEVDGAGELRTYVSVILPTTIPLAVTVFMLAFAWQYTDAVYAGLFYSQMPVASNAILNAGSILGSAFTSTRLATVYTNTASMLVILPMIVLYIFLQRFLFQGIERSGIVG